MFERHKSGALHVHALVHRNEFTPLAVLRRPWTAGFSNVRVCDVGASAYVVKYSTKELLDNTSGTRPRIRASRGYGRAVMLEDQEEVKKALEGRRERPSKTWTDNLISALGYTNNNNKRNELWQFLTEVQTAHGTIQDQAGTRILPPWEIDPETGEVLLRYDPRGPRER